MRPEYKIDVPHVYEEDILDNMIEWLQSNVGKPYPWDDEENYYKKLNWEADGKWACVAGSNKYNRHPGDTLLDTWWFAAKDDAMMFSLRFA
jgi:hypothetical protein